ncbi:MAG TPA: VanZ family protein [Methylomirabilota bacterium]|nr:VanZ family protein [Methylomirabilota bacterium]
MRLRFWLPPILWMGLVFLGSEAFLSEFNTARALTPIFRAILPGAAPETLLLAHALIRKLGHLIEYAILALLWYRAFHGGAQWASARSAWWAFTISAAYAVLDETHQAWTGVRGGNALDVLLDSVGSSLALTARLWGWQLWLQRFTGFFLWIACVGGGIILSVDLWLEIKPGWLAVTTPLAAMLLLARWRFGFLSSRLW